MSAKASDDQQTTASHERYLISADALKFGPPGDSGFVACVVFEPKSALAQAFDEFPVNVIRGQWFA